MPPLVKDLDPLDWADSFGVFEDFLGDVSVDNVVITASDSGTGLCGDAVGGILALVASDGTVADNDETYAESPNEVFKFAANKPIDFMARVQFTEANTDDANVIVGMKDAVAADTILDNGGGPAASYSGMVFFKVDGGTKWQVESSIAGTQSTNTTTVTAGGSAYQLLEASFRPVSSTVGEITFKIDGQECRDNSVTGNPPIKHYVTFASATEMQLCAGVKNGAANLETLNVDFWAARQKR